MFLNGRLWPKNLTDWRNPARSLVTIAVQRRAVDRSIVKKIKVKMTENSWNNLGHFNVQHLLYYQKLFVIKIKLHAAIKSHAVIKQTSWIVGFTVTSHAVSCGCPAALVQSCWQKIFAWRTWRVLCQDLFLVCIHFTHIQDMFCIGVGYTSYCVDGSFYFLSQKK